MEEREQFISLVNSSEAVMNAIIAKENLIGKFEKWKKIDIQVFHPPINNGKPYTTVLGILLRVAARVLVVVWWFTFLALMLPAIIGEGFAYLIHVNPLPVVVQVIIMSFGVILWLAGAYGLLIFFKIKKSQLNKEIATLQQDPSLGWIPESLRNGFCFGKLKEYVQYNRAGSVKEALNQLQQEYYQAITAANSMQ